MTIGDMNLTWKDTAGGLNCNLSSRRKREISMDGIFQTEIIICTWGKQIRKPLEQQCYCSKIKIINYLDMIYLLYAKKRDIIKTGKRNLDLEGRNLSVVMEKGDQSDLEEREDTNLPHCCQTQNVQWEKGGIKRIMLYDRIQSKW